MKSKMMAIKSLVEMEELLELANTGEIEINSFIPNITLLNSVSMEVPVVLVSITMKEEENTDE